MAKFIRFLALSFFFFTAGIFLSSSAFSSIENIPKKNTKKYRQAQEKFINSLNQYAQNSKILKNKVLKLDSLDIPSQLRAEVSSQTRLNYAKAYLEVDNFEGVLDNLYILKDFEKYNDNVNNRLKLEENLAVSWQKKGSIPSLRFYMNKLFKNPAYKPDHEIIGVFLGKIYLDAETYKNFRNSFYRIETPDNELLYLFSKVALKYGDYDAASKALKKIDPGSLYASRTNYALGTISVKWDKFKEALNYFEKCKEIESSKDNPDNLIKDSAYLAIARIHSKQHDFKSAIEYYTSINNSSRFYDQARFELSYAYYKIKQTQKSIEILDYLLATSASPSFYLDTMTIKGKSLPSEIYLKTANESYDELFSRLIYEKTKLLKALKDYRGSEESILAVLDDYDIETKSKTIPSSLTRRNFLESDAIKSVMLLRKEIYYLKDNIRASYSRINSLKDALQGERTLPSLNNTYAWLLGRQKDILTNLKSILSFIISYSKFHGINVNDKLYLKDKDFSLTPDTIEGTQCVLLKDEIAKSLQITDQISKSISEMNQKSFDMNKLVLRGWSIMHGERERVALMLKNSLSAEHREIKNLTDENTIYNSGIKRIEHLAFRYCLDKSMTNLKGLISNILLSFSKFKSSHDKEIREKISSEDYHNFAQAYSLVYSLSDLPERISSFSSKLFNAEKEFYLGFPSQIEKMEKRNSYLEKHLASLEDLFSKVIRPLISKSFNDVIASVDNYSQNYSWNLVNSHFQEKKDSKKDLKRLYLLRERELSRLNNNFKLILNAE